VKGIGKWGPLPKQRAVGCESETEPKGQSGEGAGLSAAIIAAMAKINKAPKKGIKGQPRRPALLDFS